MKRVCQAAVCLAVAANATTASEGAKAWLHRHPAAQVDELDELRGENPDAYAIVKALLTKRSLGLLDPKHPTASFAAGPPKQEEPQLSGAAAYAKFATPAELASVGKSVTQADAVDDSGSAVEVPVVSHHQGSWLNWKPSESAVDDDALVDSVMGSAPSTPKKSLLSQGSREQSPFAKDEDLLAPDMPAAAPAAVAAAPEMAAAPLAAQAGNPYLNGLDLGAPAQPVAKKAAMAATNSQPNYLASFSWGDDEAATKPQAAPKQRLLQKKQMQTQQQAAAPESAFASWLGGGSKAPVPTMTAVAAPAAQEQNPYTAGLW